MIDGLRITGIAMTPDAKCGVMETAFDAGFTHGIGYWADIITIKEIEVDGKKRFGAMLIRDREAGGKPDLTILGLNNAIDGNLWLNGEVIERAVARILEDPVGTDSAGCAENLFSYDNPDGPLADCIIQVACFGKIIYG